MLLSEFEVDERYLAHTSKSFPKETLIAHSKLTLKYYEKIVKNKYLDSIIDNLIEQIDSRNSKLIKEMFVNAIYLHDLGKKNPCFQAKKMNNPHFSDYKNCGNSRHSNQGALEFINYYMPKINALDDEAYFRMVYIIYSFSYHINEHHGKLKSMEKYFAGKEKEHPDFTNIKKDISIYLDKKFEFYILNKLLFSLLVSCDYYATSEYMTGLPIEDFGVLSDKNIGVLNKKFQNHMRKIQNPTGINKLRSEMFHEAQENLLNNLDKSVFYLEAPTGSGKTITSINLALNLLKANERLNKLFYIFPFNTLVEQTKNVFNEIFENTLKIEVINSITPIFLDEKEQEDKETEYTRSYINRLFFHSPAIITTHVSLFNILFGTSKEDNFPFWQLANSVIILDEIQSYNNHLWWYMVEFFEKYATLLNMKIIIMSATLPKLDYFLNEERKESFVELIVKKDYFFKNNLFKNRVNIDFSLLDSKMTMQSLYEAVKSQPKEKKILIEFIKKQSAREFYNLIKDQFENVYELSGDDNKAYRQYIINKSKKENLIIVATQVIEAGVDIDMDIGFKDISTLDSEEQFMGRINRNCKRKGIVYFFDLDDEKMIYKGDNRLEFNLKHDEYKKILINKEFDKYYKKVLEKIKTEGDRFQNGLLTNYNCFEEILKKLDYKEISKTMTLINSQHFTLYFPFKIDISMYSELQEFENLDDAFLTDGKLDGQKVWDAFVSLNDIEEYPKKVVLKSKINSLMQFFTFTLLKASTKQQLPYYSKEFYGYYFVNDLSFVEDGKFDRQKYLAKKEEIFM